MLYQINVIKQKYSSSKNIYIRSDKAKELNFSKQV